MTLIAVTSVSIEATADALSASLDQVEFGRAVLLSHRRPSEPRDERIEWRAIEPLTSKAAYSAFMLHCLHEHVGTSHALCIQWDGFVVNGAAWDPEFLTYDYIGAVWPHFRDGRNVGNGGFSLRSLRLLEATAALGYTGEAPEDVFIARMHGDRLEAQGIAFAPEVVARKFAFERTDPTGDEFGFHGVFNLVNLKPPGKLLRLLRSLEPQVLNRTEHKELLRWALRKRYLSIALLIVLRMLRQAV